MLESARATPRELTAAVTAAGATVGRSFVRTGLALEAYLGPGRSKQLLARLFNTGAWAAVATAAYLAGVAYVGRANEKVEPGYATPPPNPLVSGSTQSLLPFGDLGQQGRRYVTDVVTPELIAQLTKGVAGSGRTANHSPFTGEKGIHMGVDIAAPVGTAITAPADGVVIFAGAKAGWIGPSDGRIDHRGWSDQAHRRRFDQADRARFDTAHRR